jgi:hypothetical protein
MYQDYKGFVSANSNKHSSGAGYCSIEEYAMKKIDNLNYSEFIGVNLDVSREGKFFVYFIVKNSEGQFVKHELKEIDEIFFQELFDGVSLMIYDKCVDPIKKLEDVFSLQTLQIIR